MTATNAGTSRIFALAAALGVVGALGAGGMYLYLDKTRGPAAAAAQGPATPAPEALAEPAITLTPEAAARAGIQTARPTTGRTAATIAVPGRVEPNAYNQIVVRSVAGGQVRAVAVQLGAQVRSGDLLATIHTPELADTFRIYLSMQSELDAAHQRLARLEGLVKIGAASAQELEIAQAEHTRHTTDVDSAKAKLILLGVSPARLKPFNDSTPLESLVRVMAPADGVITSRSINQGAIIDGAAELFTITNLGTVWVVASVYERDLSNVQIGAHATIAASSSAGGPWSGRVSYIDPQLDPETRTARVRIEVDNRARALRLGTYTDVTLSAAKPVWRMVIARAAIQTIGDQTVVYVADPAREGRYFERSVTLGDASGKDVEVLAGLSESDAVVVAGSFTLRAERDRLGLPRPAAVVRSPGP